MKKNLLLILLGAILFQACNSTDKKPKYMDFDNDWESDNLFGKVKSISQYKANVNISKSKKSEAPILIERKEYTAYGKLELEESYNNWGEKLLKIKNKYDKNNNIQQMITENYTDSSVLKQSFRYNKNGWCKYAKNTLNDSLQASLQFEYNDNGELVLGISVQNKDTSITSFEYEYDDKSNIIRKTQLDQEGNVLNNYFEYDKSNNLIKTVFSTDYIGDITMKYEYDWSDRIKLTTEYNNEGHMVKETFYDKYFNKNLVRFYDENKLQTELKNKYEFDINGNWVIKKAYRKEHFGENKNFIHVYTDTREIEYFK